MQAIIRLLKQDLPARRIGQSKSLLSTASSLNPSKRLGGKVAFITGGASGIGEATAELFVEEGAKVIIADIQDERGRALATRLGNGRAEYRHCDMTKESDIEGAIAGVMSSHGKLDVMMNNAAILGEVCAPVTDVEADDFDKVIGVNLRGVLLGTKHAARAMIPAKRGSIINTASISGIVGLTGLPVHAYAISKSGVIGVVRSTASSLRQHGIRVNAMSPYMIDTPLVMKQMQAMRPEMPSEEITAKIDNHSGLYGARFGAVEVAKAAVFLASDDSSLITGHNLVIDGAFSSTKAINPLSDAMAE